MYDLQLFDKIGNYFKQKHRLLVVYHLPIYNITFHPFFTEHIANDFLSVFTLLLISSQST